jgi:hypothetical protein
MRKIHWAVVAALLVVSTNVHAAIISLSATAPTTNVVAQQTSDLGPGTQNGNRNFTDNGGTVGQTFTVANTVSLSAISVLGRNVVGGGYNSNPWQIQIASVNTSTGAVTQLSSESAVSTGITSANNWITLTLDTPVTLVPGTTYAFGLYTSVGGYYGLAHSANGNDAYPSGTAFNYTTVSGGGSGAAATGAAPRQFHGFISPDSGNYDYAFVAQSVAVPEPATWALLATALVPSAGSCGASRPANWHVASSRGSPRPSCEWGNS